MAIKGVDHVVIRVEDFDAAVATWKDKLGMVLDRTDESEALGIKQAFFNMDNGGYVEIVAPTNADAAVGKALASRGEGLHTLALEVDDLDATIKDFEASGVQLIGVGSPQVYVHPKSANGMLLQLNQKK
ncbi:MAG: VOC family protein [Pseudomonadales bacterium]|nr:VOC family protein [Pseudomonadales bacterium]